MTGVRIEVTVDDSAFRRTMQAIAARGKNLKPAMNSIGEAMLLATEQRFADQRDPDGTPWAPLSKRYAKRKKGPKILTERGDLRRIVYRATPDGVAWGSNRVYAAIHQYGGPILQEARQQTLLFGNTAEGKKASRFISKKEAGKKTEVIDGKRRKRTQVHVRFAAIGSRVIQMPARKYLGLNPKDRETIAAILTDHLTRD